MRRNKLQVFIICIAFIILVNPLYSLCQKQDEIDLTYGEMWLKLDSTTRKYYLMGIRDGMFYFVLNILSEETSGISKMSEEEKNVFFEYWYKRYQEYHDNLFLLEKIITSLYEDLANHYIRSPIGIP